MQKTKANNHLNSIWDRFEQQEKKPGLVGRALKPRGVQCSKKVNDHTAACKKPASLAVALNCGIGSSSLKALVNALERLHMVRAWNSINRRVEVEIVDLAVQMPRSL